MNVICAWCGKDLESGNGHYVNVSHGLCKACRIIHFPMGQNRAVNGNAEHAHSVAIRDQLLVIIESANISQEDPIALNDVAVPAASTNVSLM